jgi:hypothetical protein
MKKIFTIALLFIGAFSFAQTSTSTTTATQTPAPATLTPKAKALCKTWKLTMTENFGDQHKPTEAQKNDQLILLEDGHYRLIIDGVAEGGSWTLSKDNLWITLTSSTNTTKKLKVLESTATSLKVDYRDADDIHNILMYSTGV